MADSQTIRGLLAWIRGAGRRFFAPLAIGFLLYFAWQSRELLGAMLADADLGYLALSVLAWALLTCISPLLSVVVFRACGHKLSYASAANIHISNLPARYLPGGIWHTVGRIASFREKKIDNGDIAVFVFLENALGVGVAFMLGGTLLIVANGWDDRGMIVLLGAVGGALLTLLSPVIARQWMPKSRNPVGAGMYLPGVLFVAVSWCIAAASFVAFVRAFDQIAGSIIEIAGAYLFSWAVGFVAIFAPQGIGVFEVVAAELLRESEPLAGMAVLLAMFRLVILLADSLVYVANRLVSARPGTRT